MRRALTVWPTRDLCSIVTTCIIPLTMSATTRQHMFRQLHCHVLNCKVMIPLKSKHTDIIHSAKKTPLPTRTRTSPISHREALSATSDHQRCPTSSNRTTSLCRATRSAQPCLAERPFFFFVLDFGPAVVSKYPITRLTHTTRLVSRTVKILSQMFLSPEPLGDALFLDLFVPGRNVSSMIL